MAFQVPASKASIAQNRFEFEVPYTDSKGKPKTKAFSVPKMQYINADIKSRMQLNGLALNEQIEAGEKPSMADQIAMAKLTRELFDRYAPGLFEIVEEEQLEAIQGAWQEASGITVGESSPSAD